MAEVSYVRKEDKKVNNQYSFVSHDAVVAKMRPALIKQGILFASWVQEVKVNGNRVELTLGYKFINTDNPTDLIEGSSFGFGIDPQDKGPGKAMSYAKKYALLQAMLLETGDDPERDMIDYVPPKPVKARPASLKNLIAEDIGKAEQYLVKIMWLNPGQTLKDLTPERVDQIKKNWEGFCDNAGIS